MKQKTLSKTIFSVVYVAVAAACVALDQLTKLWIFDGLLEGRSGNSVEVLGKFLKFSAHYNAGAAFGMGQSDSANIVFFIITLIGIPLFAYMLWRSRTRSVLGQVGYAFIIGGTIGNAIDRAAIKTTEGMFFSGKVRDFISFSIFPPIFNVADSFLVIGVAFAIVALVLLDSDSLVHTYMAEKAEKLAAKSGEQQAEEAETGLEVPAAEAAVLAEEAEQAPAKAESENETD